MIQALVLVTALAFGGHAAAALVDVPVPGPALGLGVLMLWFCASGGPDTQMCRLFDGLVPHGPVLFVPAGVGVVTLFDRLAEGWIGIAFAIAGSTTLALVATGHALQAVLARADAAEPA